MTTRLSWMAVLSAVVLAACGGGEGDAGAAGGGNVPTADPVQPATPPVTPPMQPPLPGPDPVASGTVDPGGVTTTLDPGGVATVADPRGVTTVTLPDGVVLRESFGFGASYERPSGGKGTLKSTLYVGLDGFWAEYPDSSDVAWSGVEQGWGFAGCSTDPNEAPSGLQTFNGCVVSPWRDDLLWFPDSIVPFAGLATPYVVSIDLYPGVVAGAYAAIGLSGSPALTANLQTSGLLWILLRQGPARDGLYGEWELRRGASTVLATGTMPLLGYNPVSLRYDPIAGKVTATVNGANVGTYDAPDVAPRYLVLEGQGWADNLVVYPAP